MSFVPSLSVPSSVRFVTIWMANSNSFMNVVIYSAMYSSFRRNCVWVFRCSVACLLCWPRPDKPLKGLDPTMYNPSVAHHEEVDSVPLWRISAPQVDYAPVQAVSQPAGW